MCNSANTNWNQIVMLVTKTGTHYHTVLRTSAVYGLPSAQLSDFLSMMRKSNWSPGGTSLSNRLLPIWAVGRLIARIVAGEPVLIVVRIVVVGAVVVGVVVDVVVVVVVVGVVGVVGAMVVTVVSHSRHVSQHVVGSLGHSTWGSTSTDETEIHHWVFLIDNFQSMSVKYNW